MKQESSYPRNVFFIILLLSLTFILSPALAQQRALSMSPTISNESISFHIVMPNLTTILGTGNIANGQLILSNMPLPAGKEVRILISNIQNGQVVMPIAFVSQDGSDLLLPDANGSLFSLRQWLYQNQNNGANLFNLIPLH
ncbi:MAG: hypothetical protein R2880_01450 [Deinococcales bacterium]